MSQDIIKIGILEPSAIICEGMANVLFKLGHYDICRIDHLFEVSTHINNRSLRLIILNPIYIQNQVKEFMGIKKIFPGVLWGALVYGFFSADTLSLFDFSISITDDPTSISNQLNNLLFAGENAENVLQSEQLTERETDVLKLLVTGLSNKEIADKLNISIHTVISHRKNITQKTGIKTQSGLTIYAISNKLISL